MSKLAYSIAEIVQNKIVPIGRGSLYREIREKRLKATKIGRRTIILATDLDAWLQRLQKTQ